MKSIIREITLWLGCLIAGVISMFGCFSDVDSDNGWLLIGSRIIGAVAFGIMVGIFSETKSGKRINETK